MTGGTRPSARTLVQHAVTGTVRDRTDSGRWTAVAGDRPTDEWFGIYWSVESGRAHHPHDARVYRTTFLRPQAPACYVTVSDRDQPCAVGQVVLEDGWGGVQCVATLPDRRRRGAALAVLHHLALHAALGGAERMYLAVMADHHGAQHLYEQSGFVTSHDYCFYARP